jgi:uncharacterized protein YbbC (DUF1343 family)
MIFVMRFCFGSFLWLCCLGSHLLYSQIPQKQDASPVLKTDADIQTGARRMELYLPLLKGKTVALVANHTSCIGSTHLVDSLLALGIKVKILFCPEHGFRGK